MAKKELSAKTWTTGFPVRLHLRNDLHLARKVWHMGTGLLMVAIYLSGLSRTGSVLTLGSLLGVALLIEGARLRMPAFNKKVLRYWGPLMRSSEVNRVSGVPYYLAAAILAVGIFPKPIAALSLLYLACGDPIASLFGILYGHHSVRFANGKSLVGSVASVVTCMFVTFLFFNILPVRIGDVALLTLVGGLAGGLAEHLPLEVDDNFSIPVISGFALWLACILLGISF